MIKELEGRKLVSAFLSCLTQKDIGSEKDNKIHPAGTCSVPE